jgi:hypothetical protein
MRRKPESTVGKTEVGGEGVMRTEKITIGRGIRWYNNYQNEVNFSVLPIIFDFMQILFSNGELLVQGIPEPKSQSIKINRFSR